MSDKLFSVSLNYGTANYDKPLTLKKLLYEVEVKRGKSIRGVVVL